MEINELRPLAQRLREVAVKLTAAAEQIGTDIPSLIDEAGMTYTATNAEDDARRAVLILLPELDLARPESVANAMRWAVEGSLYELGLQMRPEVEPKLSIVRDRLADLAKEVVAKLPRP